MIAMQHPGTIFVGVSGWSYPHWRGRYCPPGLPQKKELAFVSRQLNSVEINGSFYSLQKPSSYESWRAQSPPSSCFSVKGPKFITHMKKLKDVKLPLANFFASGLLLLGPQLGPILWQLPPQLSFDQDRLGNFFNLLPRTFAEAAALAQQHDDHISTDRAYTSVPGDVNPNQQLRYAIEPRHETFNCPDFYTLCKQHGAAVVVADTAGKFPYLMQLDCADFLYLRLHGHEQLYSSGYTQQQLQQWAHSINTWRLPAQLLLPLPNSSPHPIKMEPPREPGSLPATTAAGPLLSCNDHQHQQQQLQQIGAMQQHQQQVIATLPSAAPADAAGGAGASGASNQTAAAAAGQGAGVLGEGMGAAAYLMEYTAAGQFGPTTTAPAAAEGAAEEASATAALEAALACNGAGAGAGGIPTPAGRSGALLGSRPELSASAGQQQQQQQQQQQLPSSSLHPIKVEPLGEFPSLPATTAAGHLQQQQQGQQESNQQHHQQQESNQQQQQGLNQEQQQQQKLNKQQQQGLNQEQQQQQESKQQVQLKDVYVYFDNDALCHAPYDAIQLQQLLLGVEAPPAEEVLLQLDIKKLRAPRKGSKAAADVGDGTGIESNATAAEAGGGAGAGEAGPAAGGVAAGEGGPAAGGVAAGEGGPAAGGVAAGEGGPAAGGVAGDVRGAAIAVGGAGGFTLACALEVEAEAAIAPAAAVGVGCAHGGRTSMVGMVIKDEETMEMGSGGGAAYMQEAAALGDKGAREKVTGRQARGSRKRTAAAAAAAEQAPKAAPDRRWRKAK